MAVAFSDVFGGSVINNAETQNNDKVLNRFVKIFLSDEFNEMSPDDRGLIGKTLSDIAKNSDCEKKLSPNYVNNVKKNIKGQLDELINVKPHNVAWKEQQTHFIDENNVITEYSDGHNESGYILININKDGRFRVAANTMLESDMRSSCYAVFDPVKDVKALPYNPTSELAIHNLMLKVDSTTLPEGDRQKAAKDLIGLAGENEVEKKLDPEYMKKIQGVISDNLDALVEFRPATSSTKWMVDGKTTFLSHDRAIVPYHDGHMSGYLVIGIDAQNGQLYTVADSLNSSDFYRYGSVDVTL